MSQKYNFDEMNVRRGSNCVKWDAESPIGPISEDVIPLWVADMDFKVAPAIVEALKKRVDHQIFGYTHVPESYYKSAIDWWQRRRGWHTEKEWYSYIPGIVPGMTVVVKAITQYELKNGEVVEKENRGRGPKGELPQVIIQSPAYNCFFSTIRNNVCELVENNLIYNTKGEQPTWDIDFEDLEKKAANPMAKVLLFCNPHNPCGRIWTKEELEKVAEICRRNNVIVVSDEIHCELEMPGYRYTPTASISKESQDNTITMNSPSKSFNIAGLGISNIITNNPTWKKLIDKVINIYELCDVNPFGVEALQAAYAEGEPWLEQLNEYIWGNYNALLDYFKENAPEFAITKLEGTYLVWVDTRKIDMPTEEIEKSLLENEKVWINAGKMYGLDGFMRINLACPRERLMEGVRRIVKGFKRLS